MTKALSFCKVKLPLCLFLMLLFINTSSFSQIAAWNPTGLSAYGPSPWAATSTASNITVGGLTRGAGVTTTSTAAGSAWGGNFWGGASNQDATFTITANAGFSVSLSVFNLSYRRSGTGPATGTLEYSINGSPYTVIASLSFSSTSSSGAAIGPVDLSTTAALQNVTNPNIITMRVLPTGGASGGTWYVYTTAGLSVDGTVNAIASGPVISGFAPPSACAGSGVSVVITGSGFTGASIVSFNGTTASFVVNNPNQITATLPAGATTGVISVTTPGGTGTSSVNFVVNTSPVITCPANISTGNAAGLCGANVSFNATATGSPAPTFSYAPASGSFFSTGTTTVIATASNTCGVSNCNFSVTVNDNEAPNAICQNITLPLNAAGTASITPAQINNGSTDNCGTVNLVSVVPNTFSCANVGVSGASDLFISEYVEGNIGSNKYIEIFNGTSASINLGDYRLRLYANGATTPTNDVLLSGNLAAGQTIVYQNSAATLYLGPATNNAAVNFNGDDALALFKISSNSNVDIFGRIGEDPGTAWTDGINSTLDRTLRRKATVTQGITVNPAAGFPTLLSEWDQFPVNDVSGLGAHTNTPAPTTTPVTLTINDGNGNTSTCVANVTVLDVTPPTAVCQSITVPLDANGNASILASQINNGSSDACGIAGMTVSPNTFTCANIGPNPVTLTVTDVNGLSSTCTATVTIVDNTPPTASCQNITINLDASGNASITAAQINNGSSDNCGIATMTVSPNTFNCSNATPVAGPSTAWINEIHYDNVGTDAGEFIELAGNAGLNLTGWSLVLYNGANGLSYNTIALSGILSNQSNGFGFDVISFPTDGLQNGSPDGMALVNNLNNVVQFLSYEGTMTALNGPANGQTSTDIGVAESSTTPAGFSLQLTGTGSSYGSFTWAAESASTANAANNGQTFVAPAGNTVTLTVTDVNGLTSTCTAIVTVNDITPPVAMCQNITVPLNASGTVTVTASQVDNGSSDACGIASMSLSQTSFSCADIGPNPVTLTVTDVNGLSSTCSATITIADATPPQANCQSITVQLDGSGSASVTASQIDNGSTDNCGILSMSVSPSTFNCSDVAGDPVSDLFISEYIEGSSNNKAIEIYNGTGAPVNLAAGGYALKYYFNGSSSSGLTINLTGTVAAGDVYVVAQSTANAAILAQADQTNGSGWYNGDDAVELIKSGSVRVDLIGRIGEDPGTAWVSGANSTLDHTLVRRSFVTQGVTVNPASGFPTLGTEWNVYPVDNSANLGSHTMMAGNLVTLTVNDVNGNSSTCTAYVTVQDVTPPLLTCPFSGTISRNTDPGACTYTAQAGEFNATASDNCSVTSLTYQLLGATGGTGTNLNGVAFNKGNTIIRWIASDGVNPVVMCNFALSVNDNEAPVFTTLCPASFAACNAPGISWTEPVATDNCGTVTLTSNYSPGATFPPGTTTVTYTATDPSGNSNSCSFDVTVKTESTDPASANASPAIVCAGDQSTLTVSGGSLGTGAVWKWYAGSCGGTLVGIGSSINVNTNSTTTYYVRAEGDCNTTGCVSTTVTVRSLSTDPASATSNAPVNGICIGSDVTLTVNGGSLGDGADWVWYEDGCGNGSSIGSGSSITITPAFEGLHSYYVRAEGPCNTTNCAAVSVLVGTYSIAATSITSSIVGNSICNGNNITLTVNGGFLGTVAVWHWYSGSCGGTAVGTGTSITVSPSATTTYFVRAEGSCNSTNCVSLVVNVSSSAPTNPPPTITTAPNGICSGNGSTVACNAVSGATFYSWSGPNGTTFDGGNPSPYITTSNSVQVTFGNLPAGVSGYDICVFAGNGCGNSVTKCRYIRGRVQTAQTITGNASSCPNTSSTYSIVSLPGADSYTWTVTGAANINGIGTTVTTTSTSVTVNFLAGWTNGTLSVYGSMNCGYSAPAKTITIVSTPVVPGIISGPALVCPNTAYNYSIAPVTGAISYNWSTNAPGAIISGTGTSISITFGSSIPSGTTVSVTATGSCGTSAPQVKNIGTGLATAPGFITGPTLGQCGLLGVSYSILPVGGATSYFWSATNGATVSSPNGLTAVSIDFPASFVTSTVSVVAVNSCGNSSPQTKVVTGAAGQPGLITGSQAVCNGALEPYSTSGASGANSYIWSVPGDAFILSGQNSASVQVLWGASSGNVSVYSQNDCGASTTRSLNVSVVCRQAQVSGTTLLNASLFPNPTGGNTTVKFEAPTAGSYQVSLVDVTGRVISSETVNALEGINMHELDLTGFTKGLYLVRLERTGEPLQMLKLTIQ